MRRAGHVPHLQLVLRRPCLGKEACPETAHATRDAKSEAKRPYESLVLACGRGPRSHSRPRWWLLCGCEPLPVVCTTPIPRECLVTQKICAVQMCRFGDFCIFVASMQRCILDHVRCASNPRFPAWIPMPCAFCQPEVWLIVISLFARSLGCVVVTQVRYSSKQ